MVADIEPDDRRGMLERIRMVTDAALSTLHVDELLSELLKRTVHVLDADTATVLVLDSSRRELTPVASIGLEQELELDIRVPVGMGFTGRIAETGEPLVLRDVNRDNVFSPVLLERHITSMAGVPMMIAGRLIGVLHVGCLATRDFTEDDLELLRLAAERAALAAQTKVAQVERVATLALQRSLLPIRPARIAGLDVGVRYVPAVQFGVGGDWYDLIPLPSGHVGLVIGDVAGNGLPAAVVMGRIRSALRAYALETTDPADVLTRLDHKIQVFEPGAMATAVYAVINPERTQVVISVAGHPLPIMIEAGRADVVKAAIDVPLGAVRNATRHNTVLDLALDTGLLLYTDGLIERRYQSIDEGVAQLLAAIVPGSAELLCVQVISEMLHNGAGSDDVAVVAVRVTSTPDA